MLEGYYRQINYPHNCSGSVSDMECYVTNPGSMSASYVPSFTVRDYDLDTRLAIRVMSPRIYVGVGYMWRTNNYGYPHMNNWGFGIEKLPDLNHTFGFYGSAWYYPNVKGYYGPYTLGYNVLKYDIGVSYSIIGTPIFVEGGWQGEHGYQLDDSPVGTTENGPYLGLGIKF